MTPSRVTLALLALVAPAFAGCVGDLSPGAGLDPAVAPAPPLAYAPIDEARLTESVYDVLPMVTDRVAASVDGIPLFVEMHLPDGEGPFPTILHSSPYNALERIPGRYPQEAYPQRSLVEYFVPRGYAVVVADVRGFGESGGCVEVWGPNEQQDQYDLVEWLAAQPWSNGKVGMIGVSYPGTTPIEAAVLAPPHLAAIVAVAGLTDPYYDWHFGGVPNGEAYGSSAAYQAIGAVAPVDVAGGADWVKAAVNAGCGTADLVHDAYQTDGRYTEFYHERNFSARAKNVTVPVLYSQGFIDGNVKPSQLLEWFNAIESPKKGFFGQWGHRNPPRDDWQATVHAWFDEFLLDRDTGVLDGPVVEVTTNLETWRADVTWPPTVDRDAELHLDAASLGVSFEPVAEAATVTYRADRVGAEWDLYALRLTPPGFAPPELIFETEALAEDLYLAGVPNLVFHASVDGENVFFAAEVYEVSGDRETRVTFGQLNAALRESVEAYSPVPPGEVVEYRMRFQPREYVVEAGNSLRLVLRGVTQWESTTPEAARTVDVTLHTGGDTPTRLVLPVFDGRPDVEVPEGVGLN